jgi:FdhE protein
MAVAITSDVWAERRRRLAELRSRQGFARQLLDFYGVLLGVQESAFLHAVSGGADASGAIAYAVDVVAPRVVDASVTAGPERLRAQVLDRLAVEHPRRMAETWLEGADQPAVDRFLARASLGPVLEALGPEARGIGRGPRDARHCPDCGGPPQLSYFTPAADDIASGPRRLLCSRCGNAWTYARMTCPGCGENASAKLPIFSERGTASGERGSVVRGMPGATRPDPRAVFPHMRIEACDSCRRYLLSIDLVTEPRAVPIVDELAALPLDLHARERGFSKIVTNLMGF